MSTAANGHSRQAAMFLAGVAADETLGHWWLGTLGRDALPMKVGPWSITSDVNVGFMIAWPAGHGVAPRAYPVTRAFPSARFVHVRPGASEAAQAR
jgi:hypothetical protein